MESVWRIPQWGVMGLRGVTLSFALMLLWSCAGVGGGVVGGRGSGASLEQRVAAYWEAQKREEWEAVKRMVDPERREAVSSVLERRARGESRLKAWKVVSTVPQGDEAVVEVEAVFEVRHPLLGKDAVEMRSMVKDRWVRRSGVWYVVVEEPSLEKLLEHYRQKQ